MQYFYTSTRNSKCSYSFSLSVLKGISDDGGLFVPKDLSKKNLPIQKLLTKSYIEIAYDVLHVFADDFSDQELVNCISSAYTETFETNEVVELTPIGSSTLLELYHGPTSAFKDVALQLLPLFMPLCANKNDIHNEICILTATSGDTGKAALEGFKNKGGVQIFCYYPNQLVSKMQEKQMLTTKGNNTHVYAVEGNFDDCQRIVKEIFNDEPLNLELLKNKIQLSSANSINIGRLCPQAVYYFYSYCKLVNSGVIKLNDKVNFVVPTGNFGNILAGYYAKCLGLPINKLICASNENNVLTEFIQTGHYNKKRDFHKTISPSMDILVSSNVERYLFEIVNHNSDRVNELMNCLSATGEYKLDSEETKRLNDDFTSYYANDDETKDTIRNIYNKYEKVIDPHTAVAMNCYEKYQHDTKDSTHTIILSTASPYKFAKDVVEAILKKEVTSQEQALLELSSLNKESMPYNLEQLLHIDVQNPTILKQKEVKSNLINELEKKHE